MFKRILAAIITSALLATSLASCADGDKNVISVGETSGEESVFTVEDAGLSYTQNDFDYFYKLQKSSLLSFYQYYQSMGYEVTPDNKIAVGDTEEFWSTDSGVKDDDGNTMTFGQYFYTYSLDAFKSHIARMVLAKEYEIKYDDEFYKELNTAIAEDIVANSLVPEDEEVIDDKGQIPAWIMDRWEMHLAAQKLDKDSWIEFNYTISKVDSILMDKLEEKGEIVPKAEAEAKTEVEKLLAENIEEFMKSNVKFKYIAYSYLTADDFKKDETSEETTKDTKAESIEEASEDSTTEVSEESVDESTDDESAEISEESKDEELTPEEQAKKYNEELKAKCEAIYQSVLAKPESFDSEVEKCDMADYILPDYKEGLVLETANFKQVFGAECPDNTAGKIYKYETDVGVHIIMFVELTEKDSGISRTATDEDIKAAIEQSLTDAYSEILVKYAEKIAIDEEFTAAYKVPWKV